MIRSGTRQFPCQSRQNFSNTRHDTTTHHLSYADQQSSSPMRVVTIQFHGHAVLDLTIPSLRNSTARLDFTALGSSDTSLYATLSYNSNTTPDLSHTWHSTTSPILNGALHFQRYTSFPLPNCTGPNFSAALQHSLHVSNADSTLQFSSAARPHCTFPLPYFTTPFLHTA